MNNFKEVKISEIFDIIKGKSLYTKTYINENMGVFPVFSSQTTGYGIVGNISTYDYSRDCITWTTDGIHAGTPFLRENCKFSMTTHCGALFLLDEFKEKIFLRYVFDYLKIYLKNYAIGTDNKRITSGMIKDVFVKIPVNKNGEFDLEKQKKIAGKYEKLEKIKDRIRIMKEDIENQGIEILPKYKIKEFKISELFDFFSSGKLRKINELKGMIPVLSGQKSNNGIIGFTEKALIKDCSKNNPYITFGDHTRFIRIRTFNFNTTDSIRIIRTKKEFKNNLNLEYVIKNWEKQIPNLGYARHWKVAKDSIIKIPMNKNGEFDLEKQKEIADKYEKIEKIKNNLIEELEYLEKVKVEL